MFIGDLAAVFCKFSQRNKEIFPAEAAYECPNAKDLFYLLRGKNIFGLADMIIAIGAQK
jgi:hypothetical protein